MSEVCNFIKKGSLAQVFSCEFCKSFKNTFFIEHLCWLLLNCIQRSNHQKCSLRKGIVTNSQENNCNKISFLITPPGNCFCMQQSNRLFLHLAICNSQIGYMFALFSNPHMYWKTLFQQYYMKLMRVMQTVQSIITCQILQITVGSSSLNDKC